MSCLPSHSEMEMMNCLAKRINMMKKCLQRYEFRVPLMKSEQAHKLETERKIEKLIEELKTLANNFEYLPHPVMLILSRSNDDSL